MELAVERERLAILEDFIRGFSHEFRTPLSVINANLYVLEKNPALAGSATQLQSLKGQVSYITVLVEAMLTLSRLDLEKRAAFAPLNLNHIIAEIENRLQSLAQEKGKHPGKFF